MTTTKNLEELIDSWKFDYVNLYIDDESFPEQEIRSNDYKLFHFDKDNTSENIIEEMKKEGYLPANIYELLNWKNWNGKDWVVALGSVGEVSGNRHVPYLIGGVSKRYLDLGWWGYGWRSDVRFLVVRNSSLGSLETKDSSSDTLPLAIETVKKAGYIIYKQI